MPKPQSIKVKDLFHLTGYTAVAGVKAVKTATVVPFKGKHRHGDKPYVRKVLYEVINDFMIGVSVREVQFVHPSTATSYKMVCVRKGLKQRVNHLPNNTTAFWLNYNEKTKKNVLVWFHGGGYVLACTDGHIRFLYSDLVKKTGNKYAVCILAYTLAPGRQYPTQLIQASTLINYLISQEQILPRDIILGGDSAGGNLALGLLGHSTHAHPACPKLLLKNGECFRAALLMSPWVTFDSNSESMIYNEMKDYICRRSLRKWHEAFLGTAKLDAYNTPLDAPMEWWQGVPVKSILFTGGGDELFRSDIENLGKKISQVHSNCRTMIFAGDVHDQPFIDRILYMRTGKQCSAIISWLSTLEIPEFESDCPMHFNSTVSTTSYRSLASHQKQPNKLRKVQINASVTPMESPDEIPEGKLEHMVHSPHSHLSPSLPLHGRLPQDNGVHNHSLGVDTGDNFIDDTNIAAEGQDDPPELRDNRVNWQHPPTMEVLHARHRQNSDSKPTTPADFARLHREENERYAREWKEKQAERQREAEDKKRAERRQRKADERANRPARHQLREQVSGESQQRMNGHTHTFSYDLNPIDPQYIPMPASPPRSDDSLSKALPLNPGARSREHTPPRVQIPALQQAQQTNLRENPDSFNDAQLYGQQYYDLSTLGGQLTPQRSYRSAHSNHSHPSPRSHPQSPYARPETGNSIKSDEYLHEPVSPLGRNETPEVHEARMEQLVRAQRGEAKEWHDLGELHAGNGSGRRF